MTPVLNIEQARFNMVEQQIRTWEVLNQDILDLLYLVHRENFVPEAYRTLAFCDLEIPLGEAPGERMWAPRMEARVLQELKLNRSECVLEVGTGSGYLCALLSRCAGRVISVDINPRLAKLGESNLAGIDNAMVEVGDAARGWQKHAPYDVIVLTGSVPVVPAGLLEQIKPGGRLFAIVGDEPVMSACMLIKSASGSIHQDPMFETCAAPLVNASQPVRFQF
ncbi:MAG: protein-L-isoaspartate O-methyltransferase [Betaproteobacteria bacterium]|nr:protein-L-isoaspartate O-methyltransferase [Betaproteobacteria bacterium]